MATPTQAPDPGSDRPGLCDVEARGRHKHRARKQGVEWRSHPAIGWQGQTPSDSPTTGSNVVAPGRIVCDLLGRDPAVALVAHPHVQVERAIRQPGCALDRDRAARQGPAEHDGGILSCVQLGAGACDQQAAGLERRTLAGGPSARQRLGQARAQQLTGRGRSTRTPPPEGHHRQQRCMRWCRRGSRKSGRRGSGARMRGCGGSCCGRVGTANGFLQADYTDEGEAERHKTSRNVEAGSVRQHKFSVLLDVCRHQRRDTGCAWFEKKFDYRNQDNT
jgi:hypothetical protein